MRRLWQVVVACGRRIQSDVGGGLLDPLPWRPRQPAAGTRCVPTWEQDDPAPAILGSSGRASSGPLSRRLDSGHIVDVGSRTVAIRPSFTGPPHCPDVWTVATSSMVPAAVAISRASRRRPLFRRRNAGDIAGAVARRALPIRASFTGPPHCPDVWTVPTSSMLPAAVAISRASSGPCTVQTSGQ